jgi:hypothetical protein
LHNARRRLRAILGPTLGMLLCFGLALALASPALAGDPIIRFGIRVLQASSPERPTAVSPEAEADERLRMILPRLRTLFRYTDYTTLDRQRAEVPLGTQQRFPLPGPRLLEVTPDQLLEGNTLRMRVRLLRGEQAELRTIMSVAPGAPAVLGGPPHGDGVLVIILWANPNPAPTPGR